MDEHPDEFPSLKATLWRYTETRVPDSTIRKHLLFISLKALRKMNGWECTRRRAEDPVHTDRGWEYRLDMTFKAKSSDADPRIEMEVALDFARRNYQRFKDNPYLWDDAPTPAEVEAAREDRKQRKLVAKQVMNGHSTSTTLLPDNGIEEGDMESPPKDVPVLEDLDPSVIILPHQIYVPRDLLIGDDTDIDNHHAFRGIYGRAPYIRRVLMAIEAFRSSAEVAYEQTGDETDLTRNHVLLWGPPASGKTRILRGVRRLMERGSYFTLDAPSATKAGIVKLFRKTFRHRCPPIVFVEEIEKMKEGLEGWLGLLDERAELQKFTHFEQDKVKVNFLCIATCNDRKRLDTDMKGALGSRFGHDTYVPRPNMEEMRLILEDRIREIGGDMRCVDVCIELAEEFDTDDPRKIKSWLDYGRSLIDGSATRDLKRMYERQLRDFGRRKSIEVAVEDEGPSDQELAFMDAARTNGKPMNDFRHR